MTLAYLFGVSLADIRRPAYSLPVSLPQSLGSPA